MLVGGEGLKRVKSQKKGWCSSSIPRCWQTKEYHVGGIGMSRGKGGERRPVPTDKLGKGQQGRNERKKKLIRTLSGMSA